jgi:hypothetical protein
VQNNPLHYAGIKSKQDAAKRNGMQWLEECVDVSTGTDSLMQMAINTLINNKLVERVDENGDILDDEDVSKGLSYELRPSNYGRTMSACCISNSTVSASTKGTDVRLFQS